MKTLRLVVAAAVVFGSTAFATNARVESMGKTSTFIMDDISIFDNPANMNLYPNFLIGELGSYNIKRLDSGENRDPLNPWFGGIFSKSIGADKSISIGGVLNRKDERLLKYFPDIISMRGLQGGGILPEGEYVYTPNTATNIDGFLGFNVSNIALGAHVYWAHQDGIDNDGILNGAAFASALQLDAGVNIELSSNYALEVSGGAARIQYGPTRQSIIDSELLSAFARARLFSKIDAINGHLIPAASLYNMNALGRDELDVNLGMGVDAAFERGFFWMGLNGFYNQQRAGDKWLYYSNPNGYTETLFLDDGSKGSKAWGKDQAKLWMLGGTISFGIERNIWWDWFVIRVGGQKTIAYAKYYAEESVGYSILCERAQKGKGRCSENGNYFVSEPDEQDGTKNDNIGIGFGVNIEERLKVDAVVAEDVLFRNPFQGGSRILSKISATYSF